MSSVSPDETFVDGSYFEHRFDSGKFKFGISADWDAPKGKEWTHLLLEKPHKASSIASALSHLSVDPSEIFAATDWQLEPLVNVEEIKRLLSTMYSEGEKEGKVADNIVERKEIVSESDVSKLIFPPPIRFRWSEEGLLSSHQLDTVEHASSFLPHTSLLYAIRRYEVAKASAARAVSELERVGNWEGSEAVTDAVRAYLAEVSERSSDVNPFLLHALAIRIEDLKFLSSTPSVINSLDNLMIINRDIIREFPEVDIFDNNPVFWGTDLSQKIVKENLSRIEEEVELIDGTVIEQKAASDVKTLIAIGIVSVPLSSPTLAMAAVAVMSLWDQLSLGRHLASNPDQWRSANKRLAPYITSIAREIRKRFRPSNT